MNLAKFSAFTFAGALLWCAILTYAGIFLKENWHIILNYTEIIDIFIIVLIAAAAVFFFLRNVKNVKK